MASVFFVLTSARAATHVTGTYDLGPNPRVMATVNGQPQYGLVFVQRNKLVTYNGVDYGTGVLPGYLDANGQLNDGAGNLYLDLIPNLGATPADSYYVVTVNIQGQVHAEIWVVPDQPTVSAEVCRQAQPPSSTAPALFYQFLQEDGNGLPQRQKLNLTGAGVDCADNAGQGRTDCTISGGGSGGATHAIDGVNLAAQDPVNFQDTNEIDFTNPSAGNIQAALKSSSVADGKLTSSYSGVGSCSANNWVNALSRNASPTCARPGFSSLSGSATLPQLPVGTANQILGTNAAGTGQEHKTLSTGTSGSDFSIQHSAFSIQFNLPTASATARGALSSADWSTFNSKENALTFNPPLSRSVDTVSCPTCEVTGNKNAASGYAGLTAGTKLNVAQGQEVWAVADLTDFSGKSGTGTTAIGATMSALVADDILKWSGTDWVNAAAAPKATALASDPDDCSASQFATGIDTGANLTCAQPASSDLSDVSDLVKNTQANVFTAGGGVTLDNQLGLRLRELTANGTDYLELKAPAAITTPFTLTWAATGQCTGTNGGALTINAANEITCSDDDGGAGGSDTKVNAFEAGTQVGAVARQLDFTNASDFTISEDAVNDQFDIAINRNAANGIAGLDASAKVPAAQGQEVWSVADLSDFAGKSGTGTTAIGATITSPANTHYLGWDGANWINRQAAFSEVSGTVTDAQLANDYSGVGSCTNQVVTAVNDNAAPTCANVSSAMISDGVVASADLATANKQEMKSIDIFDPTTSDTNKVQLKFAQNVTLQRLSCSTDTGTVDINFDERAEGTPNTAGTNVLASTLPCSTSTGSTTSFSNAGITADAPLNLQISATSGTPGVVRIHVDYQID